MRLRRIPLIISVLSILAFFYDIGFDHKIDESNIMEMLYTISVSIGILSITGAYLFKDSRPRLEVVPFEIGLIVFLLLIVLQHSNIGFLHTIPLFKHTYWLYIAIFVVFIREFSAFSIILKRTVLNPSQLFIASFLTIIIIGGFLLMLPNATHKGISLINSMFTSTSAVCVTGLVVVDTGSYFTEFGQIIIVILIQLGGIGIMTFASYFSYFFRGVSSYENQLVLGEMTNTEKMGEVFSILKNIILVTFLIESIGAILIYQSLDVKVIQSVSERIFFSVFHSISGFCNAGFSTLHNSFYESPYRFNYPFLIIIAVLIILGGLGFPIVFNLLKYLHVKIKSFILSVFRIKHNLYTPWLININTRIVLVTSLILTVFGTLMFFVFEYDNSLSNHTFIGKIITAFFQSVTTRTAGFNSVDTSTLTINSVLIILFLMWVGASPGSTGGGIKTSSLALAVLNIISIAKGKTRLEVYKREISQTSTNRAFAIIILSIVVISVLLLMH